MPAKPHLTMQRVAHEAGVSVMTVSRVLNNRPDVSPQTRARVQRVISRLGYQPNAIARSLVSRRTRTLGLITADFSDYFFTEVIAGAEIEARTHNYFFMLGSTERNPQDEPEYFRLLTERHVEGILFARPSTEPNNRHLVALIRKGVPIVTTAYHFAHARVTVVDVDNVEGGRQATQYLVDIGHRQIAMITGPSSWKSVNDRSRGYALTLREAGIRLNSGLVAEGDWSYPGGYRAMRALLERDGRFTAVFVQNDRMAIGAMRALREVGQHVPEDISIIGYDDIPVAEFSDPPLTTVRQPMREVGAEATRLLIQQIEAPDGKRRNEVLLKTELVRRSSCAAPPRAA
jgi:LacI family transcriptional regulator, galactose operon repressor